MGHLVVKHEVLGRQVYDTRLVAAMRVHDLTQLTFNTTDFKRFPFILAVDPKTIDTGSSVPLFSEGDS
jgi:hypothetical protein